MDERERTRIFNGLTLKARERMFEACAGTSSDEELDRRILQFLKDEETRFSSPPPIDPFPLDLPAKIEPSAAHRGMRRVGVGMTYSPAETFITFCVSRYPQALGIVADGLERLRIIMPTDAEGHVRRVASDLMLGAPRPFQPADLRDELSQRHAQQAGIWEFWHPDQHAHEAHRIFESPTLSTEVMTLLSAGFPSARIAVLLSERDPAVNEKSIALFNRVFWNVSLILGDRMAAWHNDPRCPDIVRHAYAMTGKRDGRVKVLDLLGLERGAFGEELRLNDRFLRASAELGDASAEDDPLKGARALLRATKKMAAAHKALMRLHQYD